MKKIVTRPGPLFSLIDEHPDGVPLSDLPRLLQRRTGCSEEQALRTLWSLYDSRKIDITGSRSEERRVVRRP